VAALKQAVRKGKLKLLAEPPPTASQLQALTRLKEDAAAATAGDGKAAAESAVRATIDGEPG